MKTKSTWYFVQLVACVINIFMCVCVDATRTYSGRMSSKSDFFGTRYMWKLFNFREKKNYSSRRASCLAKFSLCIQWKKTCIANETERNQIKRKEETKSCVVYSCGFCIIYASSIFNTYNDLLSVTRIHFWNTFFFGIQSFFFRIVKKENEWS